MENPAVKTRLEWVIPAIAKAIRKDRHAIVMVTREERSASFSSKYVR